MKCNPIIRQDKATGSNELIEYRIEWNVEMMNKSNVFFLNFFLFRMCRNGWKSQYVSIIILNYIVVAILCLADITCVEEGS